MKGEGGQGRGETIRVHELYPKRKRDTWTCAAGGKSLFGFILTNKEKTGVVGMFMEMCQPTRVSLCSCPSKTIGCHRIHMPHRGTGGAPSTGLWTELCPLQSMGKP